MHSRESVSVSSVCGLRRRPLKLTGKSVFFRKPIALPRSFPHWKTVLREFAVNDQRPAKCQLADTRVTRSGCPGAASVLSRNFFGLLESAGGYLPIISSSIRSSASSSFSGVS